MSETKEQLTPEEGLTEDLGPEPHSKRHPSPKEYVRIAILLGVITAFEVATYYFQAELGGWLIPTLFVLSGTKFVLVVMWFMHLRFDSRRYSRFFTMGIALALTLYTIVLLVFGAFNR